MLTVNYLVLIYDIVLMNNGLLRLFLDMNVVLVCTKVNVIFQAECPSNDFLFYL